MEAIDMFDYNDPFLLFDHWFIEAKASEPIDHNAMTLSTIDSQGYPNSRVVLMKEIYNHGFVFYTNSQSNKGQQLHEIPRAAANFYWKSLNRQIRIVGDITKVPESLSDTYFKSRTLGSKIGAWASKQSAPLENRSTLEASIAEFTKKFAGGEVTRPPHWHGYRLTPNLMEFWCDMPFRLHNRLEFKKSPPNSWTKARLYP